MCGYKISQVDSNRNSTQLSSKQFITGRPEERRRCFIPYGVASAQGFLFTQSGSLEKYVATSFSTSSSPFPYKKKAASS
ncbi:hypothetical protein F2Q69_00029818 [Brassica cretica]|uniref:Uncharacterized protein n=1 Tax=Brassica cretica TaxID=69181 RepID=A0A8S9S3X9_BRACR|nr:hypothetical protein F2Q69_00029818 [Brassica cretica]